MQEHSYQYQTQTHKCYGSVSQAVSTKPARRTGNDHATWQGASAKRG